ncbi:MAG: zf-TFIIB domain-containing protein [Chloroflexota bacterium]|nr:zf-TFIIB domain-containing protein [Chloroflexota bacterium]
MKCPACDNMMIVVEHEHIELDYCPDCAGVWFDAGELELLLETMQLEKTILSIDSILTSPEAKSTEKKRKCPICHKKMKKSTVGHDPEVIIDACSRGDGLWFDAGEIGQLIAQTSSSEATDSQGRVITFLGEVLQARD